MNDLHIMGELDKKNPHDRIFLLRIMVHSYYCEQELENTLGWGYFVINFGIRIGNVETKFGEKLF